MLRLPEELYVREGVIPKELLEEYPQNLEEECQQYALKINDKIQHPVFGEGFISVIDPGRRLYEVYFYKLADSRQLNFDFVNNLCRLADKLNEKSVDYVESEVPDSFVPNCVEQHAEMEAETKDEAPIAAIGKKVSHPDFGIGTIVSVNSEKKAYVISFLIDGESKQFEFAYDLLKPKKKENILL